MTKKPYRYGGTTVLSTGILLLVAAMILLGACDGGGKVTSQSEQKKTEVFLEDEPVGIENWVRPEVTVLVQNYEHGNEIEIVQLEWPRGVNQPEEGERINEEILAFAQGYTAYLNGHPEGITCDLHTTAHFIGSEIVIVMRKAFHPAGGKGPEMAVFLYNYVLERRETHEDVMRSALAADGREALVMEAARAETGREAVSCSLSGGVWTHFGLLYFYEVQASTGSGEPCTLSLAYFEEGILGEPGKVLSGDEAFAMLKQAYPDLPPDFDREP